MRALRRATADRRDDHSSSPAIAGGIERPTRKLGRAVQSRAVAASVRRLPIWSCSVRGFACHPCCHGRGALLPHLFTLTRRRPCGRRRGRPCDLPLAVYFLCHFPSGCPDRALPGALPCGVRTFLSSAFAPCGASARRRSSGLLRRSNLTRHARVPMSSRRSPAKSRTVPASCTGCCAACRSLRRSSRCSSCSRAACRRGTSARPIP